MSQQLVMKAELIVNDHCELAEGPLWNPDDNSLYWVDIHAGRIYRYDPSTGQRALVFAGDKVGGITLQDNGAFLLFMNHGGIRQLKDGILTSLIDEIPDERETRFNDIIADPAGRVLCGLMPTENRLGNLYRLDTGGQLTLLLTGIGCSNGLAFTNGNKQVYYTDSARKEIYLYDYDVRSGSMTNRRIFWKSETSIPDGLTIDADGCIWSAQWGGSSVIRLRPDGVEDGRIEIPGAQNVTSCIFGGDGLTDLYITTARQEDEGSPNAGGIFHARPGVAGVPEYRSRIRVE
ncbi:MAG: SMP-30/gluconolactonase/LRE family protein [Capsulimonadaceae bacterium]|nr:SMP-30/gluconolactonase/LRE family protein [Capsulimonadaceae bacterium]